MIAWSMELRWAAIVISDGKEWMAMNRQAVTGTSKRVQPTQQSGNGKFFLVSPFYIVWEWLVSMYVLSQWCKMSKTATYIFMLSLWFISCCFRITWLLKIYWLFDVCKIVSIYTVSSDLIVQIFCNFLEAHGIVSLPDYVVLQTISLRGWVRVQVVLQPKQPHVIYPQAQIVSEYESSIQFNYVLESVL